PSHASSRPSVSSSGSRTARSRAPSRARRRRATSRPAPSSWRRALPTPITTTDAVPLPRACPRPRGGAAPSPTLDGQLEEVGRAGDAGIVVADRLLAAQRELLVGKVEIAFDHRAQVLLDRELVLRGRRHDPGVEDRPVLVDLIAVVEQPARSLGRPVTDRPAGRDLDGRGV